MLRRTLLLINSVYLSVKNKQLLILNKDTETETIVPTEDIAFLVIDNKKVNISTSVINTLAENNVSMIFCNDKHLPSATMLSLNANHLQAQISAKQIENTPKLKDKLWQQTIISKITNQTKLLEKLGLDYKQIKHYQKKVKRGDTTNVEAIVSKKYWSILFEGNFVRHRYGDCPNNYLNYTYAIVRAAVARALVGSGLIAQIGIHHHNKYNHYNLADDIIEPYRAFVDEIVVSTMQKYPETDELTTEIKQELLQILTVDTKIGKVTRPLMNACSISSASLVKCLLEEKKEIEYPVF